MNRLDRRSREKHGEVWKWGVSWNTPSVCYPEVYSKKLHVRVLVYQTNAKWVKDHEQDHDHCTHFFMFWLGRGLSARDLGNFHDKRFLIAITMVMKKEREGGVGGRMDAGTIREGDVTEKIDICLNGLCKCGVRCLLPQHRRIIHIYIYIQGTD